LIEQIVVAFILAFLVRGFEAEAFVIPTGSMAPTLMGRHKDVVCPQCGFSFTINASDESEPVIIRGRPQLGSLVRSGLCANCRFSVPVENEPSFNGDRILVMKFLYNLPFLARDNPRRWEVIVFHYPEEPETNFIKRLVGLPGEVVRLYYGDVLTRPIDQPEAPFRLQRKELKHQQAMQVNVWDDRHRPRLLADRPEWRRWRSDDGWTERSPGVYRAEVQSGRAELRYHHLVPDAAQWSAIASGEPLPYEPFHRLVSDFSAYNSGSTLTRILNDPVPPHWVGDLTIRFRIETTEAAGSLDIDLVEAGVIHRCTINLATGEARLVRNGTPLAGPVATPLGRRGGHDVAFANVDGRLTLWVDGQLPFGEGVVYQEGQEGYSPPTAEDLEPVRIGLAGGSAQVSDLVLTRDIYYTNDPKPPHWDYAGLVSDRSALSDPNEFAALEDLRWADFPVRPGHYLMLGDNSPRSKDSRAWNLHDRAWDDSGRQSWEVPENLLVGKAFFIYWPHGKPIWPNIPITRDLRVPFRPQVERMTWIR
jgi:signal peptidase I